MLNCKFSEKENPKYYCRLLMHICNLPKSVLCTNRYGASIWLCSAKFTINPRIDSMKLNQPKIKPPVRKLQQQQQLSVFKKFIMILKRTDFNKLKLLRQKQIVTRISLPDCPDFSLLFFKKHLLLFPPKF